MKKMICLLLLVSAASQYAMMRRFIKPALLKRCAQQVHVQKRMPACDVSSDRARADIGYYLIGFISGAWATSGIKKLYDNPALCKQTMR